jgi:MFS family permease
MLKEQFIGRNPSSFKVNSIVEAFIVSETFLWSAWNFVTPIFAIFVVTSIKGGNVQIAASAFSVCLIARVVCEIFSGKYLNHKSDSHKLFLAILGMILMSIAYLGFAFSHNVFSLFTFYILIGIGFGIASPAKYSLFTEHIDKERATTEWSMYDAVTLIGIASATALGGFIASLYGFTFLFMLASVVNLLGIIPYLFFRSKKKHS